MPKQFRVLVEADYACYTRPELKVERVSYDVPPPGALEGLLKSIYWRPAIRYVIDQIVVFNPIQFVNIRRNEVKGKVSYQALKQQMRGQRDADPCIYIAEQRTQRDAMILKDVRYGIEFHIEQTGLRNEREVSECNPQMKHEAELGRRIRRGQFFRSPCMGCAEFPARKIELTAVFDFDAVCEQNRGDHDLGFMTYRVTFLDQGIPENSNWHEPKFSDRAVTEYYRPHMIDGIIDVNQYREATVC